MAHISNIEELREVASIILRISLPFALLGVLVLIRMSTKGLFSFRQMFVALGERPRNSSDSVFFHRNKCDDDDGDGGAGDD